jgi:ribosomal protein S15P/S13E
MTEATTALRAKRATVMRRARELADERAHVAAHPHDVEMRRRLREIIEELDRVGCELRSIDTALKKHKEVA